MSISSAFVTGVSGLQANARAVGTTAENIANANTVGYRRGFTQMVTTTASSGQESGVLSVKAVDEIDMANPGGLISTSSPTDLAISGAGFFVVSVNPNETVETNYMLTRAGSFLPDESGNLVNPAGYYLAGYRFGIDGTIGEVDRNSFGQMTTVNIGDISQSAAATTAVEAKGNLPAQETGLATPGAPFITTSEIFTALGESQRIGVSWQPTSNLNEWDLTIRDQNGADLGRVTVSFNDSGTLAGAPKAYSNVTSLATAPAAFSFDTATGVATLTLDNGTTPQVLDLKVGTPNSFDGVTQFSGDFSQTFDRDGSNTGNLVRTEIDEDGILYGVFDNGQRQPLFEIPVALVDNPNGLIEEKGNAYSLTGESGGFFAMQANSGGAGGINSGALEGSNVDIAQELTELIKTQRAYTTNAKVVTTADDMMEETTRLKR
ncbi:MAG: flagellar hook protein FlgE [Alphaproteobacteria bacterium]|nr:MAG: flagellar hook protein FlgE [Alphaproteobacteria bacterium]